MKKNLFFKGLVNILVGGMFLFSCTSEEITEENTLNSEDLSSFVAQPSEQNVMFQIDYDVPSGNKVIFDVFAENPYDITSEGFVKKENLKPIISAMTDDNGVYSIERVISGGVKEIYVQSNTMGTPALLHGTIKDGLVQPTEFDLSSVLEETVVNSRSTFNVNYLGTWNFWGRPNYIDESIACTIDKGELKAISSALPEWVSVNSEFTKYDFIEVTTESELWISILSEKSLFNNALGYYCYTEGMTKDQINEVIAFPRANLSWWGNKGLKYGEYVQLKYLNPTTKKFESKFPAGTRIGWVLHRSGFSCYNSKVTKGTYQFYSNSEWNSEVNIKDHIAIFETSEGNVILGFEDTYNEFLISDNDCNDLIFHIQSSPENAIKATGIIPEVEEEEVVEEEVDVVQPLSSVIDIQEEDALGQDLWVASKSVMSVEDGSVVGVKDLLYIANTATMGRVVTRTYSEDEQTKKVVVRTTVKFSRTEEAEEKKGRTVVRTTVKNTTWEVDAESRTIFEQFGSVEELILSVVEKYSDQLSMGEVIKLEIVMEFDGVAYKDFVESISVPPYSPFIENEGVE